MVDPKYKRLECARKLVPAKRRKAQMSGSMLVSLCAFIVVVHHFFFQKWWTPLGKKIGGSPQVGAGIREKAQTPTNMLVGI